MINNLIKIVLPKGCCLYYTHEEYMKAISRVKGIMRNETLKARQEQKNKQEKGNINGELG